MVMIVTRERNFIVLSVFYQSLSLCLISITVHFIFPQCDHEVKVLHTDAILIP